MLEKENVLYKRSWIKFPRSRRDKHLEWESICNQVGGEPLTEVNPEEMGQDIPSLNDRPATPRLPRQLSYSDNVKPLPSPSPPRRGFNCYTDSYTGSTNSVSTAERTRINTELNARSVSRDLIDTISEDEDDLHSSSHPVPQSNDHQLHYLIDNGKFSPPCRKDVSFSEFDDAVFIPANGENYHELPREHHLQGNNHNWELTSYQYRLTMAGLQPIEPQSRLTDFLNDDTLKKQEEERASLWDVVFSIIALFSYLFDVGSDCVVAYKYYSGGHYWWFGLTVAFMAAPSLLMTVFSLVLYYRDYQEAGRSSSKCKWASRFLFHILQIGPVCRLFDTALFGCRSRWSKSRSRRQQYYYEMVDENTDAAFCRLFETFLEAAPQLCLQLYVLCKLGSESSQWQYLSLITSMISVSLSMVTFQRALRLSCRREKAQMSVPASVVYFMWRFLTIGCRVTAIALFISEYNYITIGILSLHFMVMMVWVQHQNTEYCAAHTQVYEFVFRLVAAFIHIFCFFNLLEGPTRLRSAFYYSLVYLQNVAMIVTWYVTVMTRSDIWFQVPALLFVVVGFLLAMIIQALYYLIFHPNNFSAAHPSIPIYRPFSELSLTRSTNPAPTTSLIDPSNTDCESQLGEDATDEPGERPRIKFPQHLGHTTTV